MNKQDCNHFSRFFKSGCEFCKENCCGKCGVKCQECHRFCCGKCNEEPWKCPACSQGVTTDQFKMCQDKNWSRCDCGNVCLPVHYKKIKTEAYDEENYSKFCCGIMCGLLCVTMCPYNSPHSSSGIDVDETDSVKYHHYETCMKCNRDFFKIIKQPRVLCC